MKLTSVMGNAAIEHAVKSGLIPDGITMEQRQKLDGAVQAALDAHPLLSKGEIIFAGSDISRLAEVPVDIADTILSNANVKVAFKPHAN